jgi:hypothetical protein
VAWAAWERGLQLSIELRATVGALAELLAIGALLVVELGAALVGLAGGLVYIVGLVYAAASIIAAAILDPTAPPQLLTLTDNIFFDMTMGMLNGWIDSTLGWTFTALVGLFYLRFALWLLREASTLNA